MGTNATQLIYHYQATMTIKESTSVFADNRMMQDL